MCVLRMRSSHAIAFYHSSVIVVANQPVLVRIYRNCAILEAWLPFMTLNMYPQNITVRLKFSVQDICPLWSHSSHCKNDLYDCVNTLPPLSQYH